MQQELEDTPYDAIWTWLASAIIAYGALTFVFLSTGAMTLLPTDNAIKQDDVKVVVAFWGALICASGLTALGYLAIIFARSKYTQLGPPWPRLKLIEGKQRTPFVARVALLITVLIPLAAAIASVVAYLKNSQIAEWNATEPLELGFVSSRASALVTDCPEQPCFRMAPLDGVEPYSHQWFIWSDVFLASVILGALVAWLVFASVVLRAR
ncbi:MAG: hypothetical protein AAGA50_03590 [Pseudomonadota bacterium]